LRPILLGVTFTTFGLAGAAHTSSNDYWPWPVSGVAYFIIVRHLTHHRDGVGPLAVGMGVVGGLQDALVADGADDVGQGLFAGLAGDDHAAGGEKIAGHCSLVRGYAKGLRIVSCFSRICPSCMSSEYRVLHPALSADATIVAS